MWYQACDSRHSWHSTGGDWRVLGSNLRRSREPILASSALGQRQHNESGGATLRLAIATLKFGGGRVADCGLVGWCQGVSKLRRALPASWRVDTMVLYPGAQRRAPLLPRPDCSGVRLIAASRSLSKVARHCVYSLRGKNRLRVMPYNALLKWVFMGMVEYDAILVADVDIDLMPLEISPRLVGDAWNANLPLLVRQRWPRLVVNADHESPLNGGLLLIRPSRGIYRDGIRVLRECRANLSHGWGLVGPPRVAMPAPRYLQAGSADTTTTSMPRVARGIWHWRPDLSKSTWFKRDDWNFVGGLEDQGFLLYMGFIRHQGLGAYFNPEAPVHKLIHWWGTVGMGAKAWQGKPWNAEMQASPRLGCNLEYLTRLELPEPAAPTAAPQQLAVNATKDTCWAELRELRRSAEAHPGVASTRVGKDGVNRCRGWARPVIPLW